jgi:transcriptional regulator with XRE-family HTH domain
MADATWFPGRLRELREAAGLTQGQLAERAGVKRDAVARWEAGKREPGWSNVLGLAEALGVDCTAFTQPPAERPTAGRGRPRKTPALPPASPAAGDLEGQAEAGPAATRRPRPKRQRARRPKGK